MKPGFVYISSNKKLSVLYIGVTSNLMARVWQHKHHSYKNSFSDKYNAVKLLYYEYFEDIRSAIQREKQLKHWKREWKWDLIKKTNSELRDLYDELSG